MPAADSRGDEARQSLYWPSILRSMAAFGAARLRNPSLPSGRRACLAQQAEPRDFHLRATVHHDGQTGVGGALCRGLVDHADLQPYGLRAVDNRVVDRAAGLGAVAKDIDDLGGRFDIGEA